MCIEDKLSEYIDTLNQEKKPKKADSGEIFELAEAVKMVRRLKEPAMPGDDFAKRIALAASRKNRKAKKIKRAWFAAAAALFAAVVTAAAMNLPFYKPDMVYAMEKAFEDVKAYHGVIEIIGTNAQGKETLQAKREIWADKEGRYYVKEIEGPQAGQITANNGEIKWQVLPEQKLSLVFTAFPDPYRFTFELKSELEDAKNAQKTEVVGEETVAGRACYILEVTPQGGLSYRLWIDKQTNLPLQKQSAMQNAIQYKIFYTSIEFIDVIPPELIFYRVLDGFTEAKENTEQYVNNIEEAQRVAGFAPKLIEGVPQEYVRSAVSVDISKKTVKLHYRAADKNVIVTQGKAQNNLKPLSTAILGKVGESEAEIISPVEGGRGYSVRWQEGGFEYKVFGNTSINEIELFITGLTGERLTIPAGTDKFMPQVDVAFDLEAEENDQKSVDAGHSPWKLDPVYVAQIFVSLKISPGGIKGEYLIGYDEIKVLQNSGSHAVVEVESSQSPVRKVYLRRLIRQDQSGIWTVVGYDPN